MELLKCHHGDCPRDISIQVLQQENKSILGWDGAGGAGERLDPRGHGDSRAGPLGMPCLSVPRALLAGQRRAPCQELLMELLLFPPGSPQGELPPLQGMAPMAPAAPSCWISIPGSIPVHSVPAAIYLHPRKVLLRVGSDLRPRCCVCAALEILDLLAVPDPVRWPWQCHPFPELLVSAVTSLERGGPPCAP